MQLDVLQENLAKSLSIASRFTSVKAQLPVLGNILLSARKTKLLVSSTNLETSVSIAVGAQIKEDGDLTISSRVITDVINNLPAGTINLESEKEHLKIRTPNFSSKILGMNASDFPSVPQTINKNESLVLPKDEFIEALAQVIFSVSVDESRPVLTGVLFMFQKGMLSLVTTDGFRLSQKKLLLQGIIKKQKVIMPKGALLELSRLDAGSDELMFLLKEKDNQVLLGFPDTVLSSRILEGEYPDFEKIIPENSTIKLRVDKEELSRGIRLSSVFARDSANIVKFSLADGVVKLSAESSQSGSQETSIDAKIEGGSKDFEIAFNYKFLEDVLRVLKGEEVLMAFSNPSSPGVFTDPKDADYLHLIMPVKIQS